jgi:hypothetical protein
MGEDEPGNPDEPPNRKTSWEIQEIAAVALLLVVAVVAVTGVAAGIVASTETDLGSFGREAVSEVLLQSTLWAGVLIAFLVVSALGLVWWQVDGWTDALEDLGDDRTDDDRDGSGPAEEADEADEAVAHIRRNRAIGTWGAVSLLVIAMGAVGALVGAVVQQTTIPPSLDWQQVISSSGSALATVILVGVGVYGTLRIRTLCDGATGVDRRAVGGG